MREFCGFDGLCQSPYIFVSGNVVNLYHRLFEIHRQPPVLQIATSLQRAIKTKFHRHAGGGGLRSLTVSAMLFVISLLEAKHVIIGSKPHSVIAI
jgi:hypothetical protein